MDKNFFENSPLYSKYRYRGEKVDHSRQLPSIQMECTRCGGVRTWAELHQYRHRLGKRIDGDESVVIQSVKEELFYPGKLPGTAMAIDYACADCKLTAKFIVAIFDDHVIKVGQFPQTSIAIDKALEKALGDYAERYKHGLICENQGYGIGAFAYYRRIVEGIIDKLLDSIGDMIEGPEKVAYLEALKKTKSSRVTEEKIDLVKDLIPPILRPDGLNPLGILHGSLSEGLHNLDEQMCLDLAVNIRRTLEFLVAQIDIVATSKKQFTQSMRKLLDKKLQGSKETS